MLYRVLSQAETLSDKNEESFLLAIEQCPVCQGAGDWYTDRGEYKIFCCTNCTLFFTSPVPDAEELKTLYRNEWSVPVGQTYTHRKKLTRAWRLGLRARKLRRLSSGNSLLEIGCGPGDFLRGARLAGFTTIVGVEPGDGEAEYARGLGFEIRNRMFLEVDFADARFDVIVSRQVIEHVLNPVEFLTTAAALLRPGGCIMLETPCSSHFKARLAGKDWRYLWPPWHLNIFNEKSFTALFEKCGLEAVSFRRHLRKTYITTVARLASG